MPTLSASSAHRVAVELVRERGRTLAEELGIDLSAASPEPTFRLLCFALLCATRISSSIAVRAARGLTDAGWTTPEAMLRSTWQERVDVLDEAGYVRYDFRTATRLGELCTLLRDRYAGDVRRIRDAAGRDPERERLLLQEFPRIGPVAADVFLREAQAAWPELRPYVDDRARASAGALGLPTESAGLARLVPPKDFPRLVAALVRTSLDRHKEA